VHDLVVISDLHLGRGLDPETKRWHRLETFFYDPDFEAFCAWLCRDAAARGARVRLVLDGDVFDLLRIEPEAPPGASGFERRFGPPVTADVAARMVRDILAGHGGFSDGLATVLAAGHEVVLLPGNHDLELQSAPPQEEVRRAVGARLAARGAPPDALARLSFEPWFHHEAGRIWIEHGCQYDPENAFRFPLRARLDGAAAARVWERDLPLGNFFQRYLYNAFGALTFIVPSSRANYRYFRFLLANEPRLLLRVVKSHGRFFLQLLRRLARPPEFAFEHDAEAAHAAELADLAARSGLGPRLREIDGLNFVGADAARAAGGILRQSAKVTAGLAAAALTAMLVWAAAWRAVEDLRVGFGWKAVLSLMLYVAFGALAAAAVVATAVRIPTDEPPRPLGDAARRIAALAGVPLVVFGHTHDEDIARLRGAAGDGWYVNTGTWIAVFTEDVLLPRERVQYTFLRVRGAEPELLRFDPGRDDASPVVLLEDERGR
jgi:UDP-2,3-diacylglucosamine pyrophosphatase LpxH